MPITDGYIAAIEAGNGWVGKFVFRLCLCGGLFGGNQCNECQRHYKPCGCPVLLSSDCALLRKH